MIKKNIDTILVGKNYISYLLAHHLREESRDVLVIEDERMKKSLSYYSYFSSLELSFIKVWYENFNIESQIDLDQIVELRPFKIFLGPKQIVLGRDNPYRNLIELCRKFPQVFGELLKKMSDLEINESLFNSEFHNLSLRLGKNLCLFKNIQNITIQSFLGHCPDFFIELWKLFFEGLKNHKENDEVSLFVYSIRAIYQNILNSDFDQITSFHLFLSLVGPRLYLNDTKFFEGLNSSLIAKGGFFRNKKIREWKFDKLKPWCVELDSFEGIIHPEHIAFIGGRPVCYPLNFENEGLYINYDLEVSLNDASMSEDFFDCYFFKHEQIGSAIPFVKMQGFQNIKNFQIYIKLANCQKPEFYKNDIFNLLKKWGLVDSVDQIKNITEGEEVLCLLPHQSINFPKKVSIFDASVYQDNDAKKALRDVYYVGPLQNSPLGLLSALLESKDFRNFL